MNEWMNERTNKRKHKQEYHKKKCARGKGIKQGLFLLVGRFLNLWKFLSKVVFWIVLFIIPVIC